MLTIDTFGRVIHPKITLAIIPNIENGTMKHVNGIIVHQTDSSTAQSTLDKYKNDPKREGAHFLIDKDGTAYQTASVYKKAFHVGKLKARCLAENMCTPTEIPKLKKMLPSARHRYEETKKFPNRYPMNADSIGIELVGRAYPSKDPKEKDKIYEEVTNEQNALLKWLVFELASTLGLPITEVYRHPVVSQKTPTEAESAKW